MRGKPFYAFFVSAGNIALTGLADRAAFSIHKDLIKNDVAKGPTLKDLKNHQHNNIRKLVNAAKRF